jgi:hypothetical protein
MRRYSATDVQVWCAVPIPPPNTAGSWQYPLNAIAAFPQTGNQTYMASGYSWQEQDGSISTIMWLIWAPVDTSPAIYQWTPGKCVCSVPGGCSGPASGYFTCTQAGYVSGTLN